MLYSLYCLVIRNKFTYLADSGAKSTWPILKNKSLIYHQKANFDVTILFGEITHRVDPEIRNNAGKGFVSELAFHVPLWSVTFNSYC